MFTGVAVVKHEVILYARNIVGAILQYALNVYDIIKGVVLLQLVLVTVDEHFMFIWTVRSPFSI